MQLSELVHIKHGLGTLATICKFMYFEDAYHIEVRTARLFVLSLTLHAGVVHYTNTTQSLCCATCVFINQLIIVFSG